MLIALTSEMPPEEIGARYLLALEKMLKAMNEDGNCFLPNSQDLTPAATEAVYQLRMAVLQLVPIPDKVN